MTVRMPRRIKIGTEIIDVVRGDVEYLCRNDEDFDPNGETYGYYEAAKGRITIANGLLIPRARKILLHEVSHAVWDSSELDQWFPYGQEEKVISHLTLPWLAALRDNPQMVRYLTDKD